MMEFNEYQSTLELLKLDTYPDEIRELFMDFIENVPYIKYLISKDRPRAKDCPRDDTGKIIVDITKPHILENMEYFMPSAMEYRKTGKYTLLRPNPNPNSEFGKWIREEVRRCFEGYVRESDGEWVTGNMYWFLNYCPIPLTKTVKGSKKGLRIVDFPEIWEGIYYRFHYIEQSLHGGLFDWEGGKNGSEISSRGKAHPYSLLVYTPYGLKTWGEIKIGDELFGDDGKITKVIDIPFDGVLDVYTITLKDGRTVQASGNHLWKVLKRHYNNKLQIVSTLDMLNNYYFNRKLSNHGSSGKEFIYAIPKNNGVDFPSLDVPVDSYTFGLLLGDGSFRTYDLRNYFYYTSQSDDMEIYRLYIPYEVRKMKNHLLYFFTFPKAKDTIESLGLYMKKSEDKFIPDIYKFNSREVRLEILKGIMDSDGFVDSNGIPIVGVSSKRLADDITFIARSLGFNCLRSIKKAGYKKDGRYIECLDSYIVRIYTDTHIFKLPRKFTKLSTFYSAYSRSNLDYSTIVNIEYSHREQCKCVTVDNTSNCYLIGDFVTTHNSKSLTMASIMSKYYILGESKEVNRLVKCMAVAYQKQYLTSDGILNKFQSYIDFLAENTEFPRKRLKSSMQDMDWTMGYLDINTNTRKGSLNEVLGVSAKDDISKVRGKRLNFIIVEEFGSFRNVLELYNIMLPSVLEGDYSFGTIYLIGTAGDDDSDFSGALEIIYNPKGYRMYALPNVFDKEGTGKRSITFFFPGYINRKGCYDKDGNSDVTKALLEILEDRYRVKYNSTDINSITKTIAEIPITPLEAILRTKGNLFPVTLINERINELDNNPHSFDEVLCGDFSMKGDGTVLFTPNNSIPIRNFPLKDNTATGAVEIFELPEKDKNNKVFSLRYIGGFDPYDNDQAESHSLGSFFILDLLTDRIVCEYTGRTTFAEDLYEKFRLALMFYNAKGLYENNKRGCFAYFSKMQCTHLLADVPEYLKDKQLVKYTTFGSSLKGVTTTVATKNYALLLLKEWLLKPVVILMTDEDGNPKEVTIANLNFIKNRAFLKECALYNPDINVDRIMAMCMVMLYREEKMILYKGDMRKTNVSYDELSTAANDEFFTLNYDSRFGGDNSGLF